MAVSTDTLLIDGSFEELSEELADYLDGIRKKQAEDAPGIKAEILSLLESAQKDMVLRKLITASIALNSAPEKGRKGARTDTSKLANVALEFIAAYNLLVHLVRQSPKLDDYLPKLCQNLSSPIKSSPQNGPGLALSVLTTIFNILTPDNDNRYHVFLAILRIVRNSSSFEALRPQLQNIDSWLAAWESDEEDQRKLYTTIFELADDAGDKETSYTYLLRAVRTFPTEEVTSDEARTLATKALKAALSDPTHFDFFDLTALDPIQALRKLDPLLFEFLEIFSSELLDDYSDFRDSNEGWVEQQGFDTDILYRKMRLLTLASLAASTPSRSLPYAQIATSLQIPSQDVEMWVIDVIRAGLVEGKLSQLNQTFLIHRSTYRVFGEKQWTEVQGRLDTWRGSLETVLAVVRAEREKMVREKEREAKEVDGKVNGAGMGGARSRGNQNFQLAAE